MSYSVVTETDNVPQGSSLTTLTVDAPAGKLVVSGGWSSTFLDVLESSYPASDGTSWTFVFKQKDVTGGYSVDLSVVCL